MTDTQFQSGDAVTYFDEEVSQANREPLPAQVANGDHAARGGLRR